MPKIIGDAWYAKVNFFGPVQYACGIISATMRTIKVLNIIAAQSGIKEWTTIGKDYKAIALASRSVTRNKW